MLHVASTCTVRLTPSATAGIIAAVGSPMRRNCTHAGAAKAFQLGLFAVLILCVMLTGCNNFCVSVVSNPGGTISGSGATCPPPKPTGNVKLRVSASLAPVAASGTSGAQHIFVTLRCMDALPTTIAGDDPPEWQALAPDLAFQPVQIDLMARPADSCALGSFGNAGGSANVRVGVYSQVRLRLVPNQPAGGEPVPAENACGANAFNCLVAADGAVHPLALDDPPELRIASERIAGGFFRVLPDDSLLLAGELDTRASFALPSGDSMRLVPMFSVSQQAA